MQLTQEKENTDWTSDVSLLLVIISSLLRITQVVLVIGQISIRLHEHVINRHTVF